MQRTGNGAEIERQLQEALAHLYDPAYRAPDALARVLGCEEPPSGEALREALIAAIEALRPEADAPGTSRAVRIYKLLHCRYMRELTQRETADRLGISPRHLRREQQEAVRVLADRLMQRHDSRGHARAPRARSEPPSDRGAAQGWSDQLLKELTALKESTPGAAAAVDEVLEGVIGLTAPVAARHRVEIRAEGRAPGAYAAIHPAVLRQALLGVIQCLAEWLSDGEIIVAVSAAEGKVCVTVRCARRVSDDALKDLRFAREMLAAQNAELIVGHSDSGTCVCLNMEMTAPVRVLVIDDNIDLVHFYRRYVQSTRYVIEHEREGAGVLDVISRAPPDIIVLDVLLPDVDGWDLLAEIRSHPEAQRVPIVVCSVVRHPELALDLGATRFLAKPVRRQEFIEALESALAVSPGSDQPSSEPGPGSG